MYPRTPHPASARRKSRLQNESQELAFRDMNSIANTFSKSDQDFLSVLKKVEEEEVSGKGTKKASCVSRRYSVASKFAGPKSEIVSIASGVTTTPGVQPKANKQASLQGINECRVNSVSTQAATGSRKNTAVLPSKTPTFPTRSTVALSLQASHSSDSKHQAFAAEQAKNIRKSSLELQRRSSICHEKVPFSHTGSINKKKGALLKTASYWLEQVKLSEVMGKHGVSIGFFRLAVECQAEPVRVLREELIAYSKQYSLWSETIQQVLQCYGVTDVAQTSSHIPVTPLVCSAIPYTANQNTEGAMASQKDQAIEKTFKCSDEKCESGSFKDSLDASSANEGFSCLEENQRLDIPGDVESMDADTVAQEVVAYIMSGLVYPESSLRIKNESISEQKDTLVMCYNQNSPVLVGGENSTVPFQESLTIQSSADQGEAGSTGSLPSLYVWNVASKEFDSNILRGPVQYDTSNVHDRDSQVRVNGEEMCIAMDLDDSVSDNLSEFILKIPKSEENSSKQSNIQTIETENTKSADGTENNNDFTSAGEDCIKTANDPVNGSSCHEAEPVHALAIGLSRCKGQEIKGMSGSVQTERSICSQLQGTTVSECQARKNSSDKYQNARDQVAFMSDKENTDNLVSSRHNEIAAISKPRRLSTSMPKSSPSAEMLNVEAGLRTRGKTKGIQAAELDNASSDFSSKGFTAAENNLATPTQANTTRLKQITLDNAGAVSGDNLNAAGSIMTPGSAGLRRSTRFRPGGGTGVSTPVSVSTPRLQRRLATPMKAQE